MDEFDGYGDLKLKVEQLVDNDKEANTFFQSLTTPDIPVIYIDTIEDCFTDIINFKYVNYDFIIFPTTIKLYNRKTKEYSTHSIVIFYHNYGIYLYDPNGNYNTDPNDSGVIQDWGYFFNGVYYSKMEDFKDSIERPHLIQFVTPQTPGIQFLLPIIGENTQYIKKGGYCMFFNYMAIQKVLYYGKDAFKDVYNSLTNDPFEYKSQYLFYKPATEIQARDGTAGPNTFEGKTKEIIENIFQVNNSKKRRRGGKSMKTKKNRKSMKIKKNRKSMKTKKNRKSMKIKKNRKSMKIKKNRKSMKIKKNRKSMKTKKNRKNNR